jgi:hypothetical protein
MSLNDPSLHNTSVDALDPLHYAIGFVVGAASSPPPPSYRRISFDLPLYVHFRTNFGIVQTPDGVVAILGEAVHPQYPALGLDGLASLLSSRAATRQAEIDQLVGRFVVIHGNGPDDLALQTDAIAMRSAFFAITDAGVTAGTHAKLVARLSHGQDTRLRGMPLALGSPGLATPYAGVRRVPPNVELSLKTGQLRRFFPLQPIRAFAVEEAWDLAFARARSALAAWSGRHRLLLSLTGGMDSRTTLAAVHDLWSRVEFFTYTRGEPSQGIDVRVAVDIAARLKLRHHLVDYSMDQTDPRLIDIIADNSYGSHGRKLSCAYLDRFGTGRYLHVRTNLLELARSNLFAANDPLADFHGGPHDADRMSRFYLKAGKLAPSEHVLPAFEDYIRSTDFATAVSVANAWDLYFVEHRMGAWHAGVVLESDVAFDTVIAFNSREIVRAFMGIPQADRATSQHLATRLAKELPELDGIPINPRHYPARSQPAGPASAA